jgi:hypothetical protein
MVMNGKETDLVLHCCPLFLKRQNFLGFQINKSRKKSLNKGYPLGIIAKWVSTHAKCPKFESVL